jgi:hypothetical protein
MPDDKTVAVRLMASNDLFKKAMLDAGGAVKGLGSTVEGEFKKISTSSQAELGKASTASQRLGTQMMSIGAATALLGAGMLAVGFKMASTFEDVGLEVLKIQRYTGLSAEASSKLRFEAQETGTSVDTLTRSLGMMAKRMESSPDKFTSLGIAVRGSNGQMRSTADVLMDVADKVAHATNATDRLQIAQDLFGRGGASMLLMLSRGRDGLQQLADEAEHYGLVLTQDNLVAVKQAIAAHHEFDAAVQGLQVQIGSKFLPILTSATSGLADFVAGNHGAIGELMLWGGAILVVGGGITVLVGKVIMAADTLKLATIATKAWALAQQALGTSALATAGIIGAAVAASVVVYELYGSGVDRAQKAQEKLNATIVDSAAKGSFADMQTELSKQKDLMDKYAEKAGKHGLTMDSDVFFWDRASATGKYNAAKAIVDQLQNYTDRSNDLAAATGISTESAYAWVTAQASAGHTFGTAGEAISAFTGKVDTSGMSSKDAAAAYKAQADALKELNDGLHAAMDPLFGMEKALRANDDAQRKANDSQLTAYLSQLAYNDAVSRYGEGSSQAATAGSALAQAQRDLTDANTAAASSALDVTTAANTLQYAMNSGKVSVQGAKDMLQEWVNKGILSKTQADAVGTSFGWVATQADVLNSKSVYIRVQADGVEYVTQQFRDLADAVAHTPKGESFYWNPTTGYTAKPNADGNIYAAYAAGGIRSIESYANGGENHVAQIAPAGAMRVWAEPETGGEAYIPLSPAKRTRSMAILGQVAGMFGASGAGDVQVNVSVPGYLGDMSVLQSAVQSAVLSAVPAIKEELRRSDRSTAGTR